MARYFDFLFRIGKPLGHGERHGGVDEARSSSLPVEAHLTAASTPPPAPLVPPRDHGGSPSFTSQSDFPLPASAPTTDKYFDFHIRIGERREPGDGHDGAGEGHGAYYPVEARLEGGAVFDGGKLELDRVGLNLAALRQDAEAHGRKLSEAIFSGPIDQAFQRALGGVEGVKHDGVEGVRHDDVQRVSRYHGLRVRISIATEAPELHTLGWERLYHKDGLESGPLATSARSPFSRYVAMRHSHPPPPAVAGPVRILVIIAHPSGVPAHVLAPIDVAAEIDNFHSALAELPAGGAVQVTFMPGRSGVAADQRRILEQAGHIIVDGPTSLDRIAARLRGGYDVLHFLGHGHFDHATSTATLHLEDASGGWDTVVDTKFTNMMHSLRRRPRLVFLAACHSATRTEHDALVGLAPKLVRANVPAVVAMQDEVSMDDARTLTRHFYANLLEHGIVDLALNQARSQLYQPDSLDWGIPVLFTQLTDGRLFAPPDARPTTRHILDVVPRRTAAWLARALVLAGVVMLLSCWLGVRAQRARELLIGISEGDAFSYSTGELLATGLMALPQLALYMLIGPFIGLGIERWAVPILAAVAGATWWLHRRGHVRTLVVGLAVLLPVLAFGAVFHAHAARVHHIAMGKSDCPDWVETVPEQVRFEVCSWLRNPTDVNERRREALAGLGAWFAVGLALLTALGISVARCRSRRGSVCWPAVGLAAMHGLLFVYALMQVPRVYAIARWGLEYPNVTAIHADCASAALRDAVANDTCQVVDVTGGADSEAWIVWGSGCEGVESSSGSGAPSEGSESARLERVSNTANAPAGRRCVLQTQGMQTILNRSDS